MYNPHNANKKEDKITLIIIRNQPSSITQCNEYTMTETIANIKIHFKKFRKKNFLKENPCIYNRIVQALESIPKITAKTLNKKANQGGHPKRYAI